MIAVAPKEEDHVFTDEASVWPGTDRPCCQLIGPEIVREKLIHPKQVQYVLNRDENTHNVKQCW